ncbi:MAG: fatty acid hydroxylase [Proteobacteria bacterium SG_bin4]|nr:MAG: fatty acid hydroxylase [Proteobacteria bacterium SG_bin4]
MNWNDWIIYNELIVKLTVFFGIFFLMAVWEQLAPCRALIISKNLRWTNNLGLVLLNGVVLRLLFPAGGVGVAIFVQQQGWGLLNYYQISLFASIIISVVAMDFIIYLQHIMMHAVPVLWRVHRVHHADLDYDLTTGIRFHPIEIILSMLIKAAVILLLGPPVLAVVVFEVLLNAAAMFNHSNIQLPSGLDRVLRWVLVTPNMHRIHHSIKEDEANSNFGFNLPWWDRLFGTYRDQPRDDHQSMVIGISGYRNPRQVERLPGMLALPWSRDISSYAINRHNRDQE